jgi:hypothetical protein
MEKDFKFQFNRYASVSFILPLPGLPQTQLRHLSHIPQNVPITPKGPPRLINNTICVTKRLTFKGSEGY